MFIYTLLMLECAAAMCSENILCDRIHMTCDFVHLGEDRSESFLRSIGYVCAGSYFVSEWPMMFVEARFALLGTVGFSLRRNPI